MNSKILPFFILSFASFILATSYNNCAQTKLETIQLASQAASLENKGEFCVSRNLNLPYTLGDFTVTNLTAVLRHGQWLADSDMDGIPDSEERALGLDPHNPRTVAHLLDSICMSLGGPTQCGSVSYACSGSPNDLNVSDCDRAALNLNHPTDSGASGIDSDHDGIPDFIEIVRGTNPTEYDLDFDLDGDGMTNRREFQIGTNPREPDKEMAEDQINKFELLKLDNPSFPCANEAWTFNLNQIILVKPDAYTMPDSPPPASLTDVQHRLDFSHRQNENVILITYRARPLQLGADKKMQIWAAVLKLDFQQKQNVQIKPTDFYLMGETLR